VTNKAILVGPGAGTGNKANQFCSVYRKSSKVLAMPYIHDPWAPDPVIERKSSGKVHSDAVNTGILLTIQRDGTKKTFIGESWDEAGKYGKYGADGGEIDAGTVDGPFFIGGGSSTYHCSAHTAYALAMFPLSLIWRSDLLGLKNLTGL